MEILVAPLAPATVKQYETALRKWWQFCIKNKIDFYTPSINNILTFLTEIFKAGVSYDTLNTLRSAISLISQDKIGEDGTIPRFLKGVYRLKPSPQIHIYLGCSDCPKLFKKIIPVRKTMPSRLSAQSNSSISFGYSPWGADLGQY